MQIYLKIDNDKIAEAKFQAIGCAGSYASGSALMEMIKGKTLEQVGKMKVDEILNHLGTIPPPKVHCACLALRTLEQTIEEYKSRTGK
jgi:nitrogen fixation NifU-like protein